jgi:hypothetical protein
VQGGSQFNSMDGQGNTMTAERKQAGALSTEEKLERLINFVNKLVEDHNEVEKRVEALERPSAQRVPRNSSTRQPRTFNPRQVR